MLTVGARELKNRLGKYLGQVQAGSTLVITERGRPIAELRPVRPAGNDLEARLAELATQGLLSLPSLAERVDLQPVSVAGAPLSRTLLEDREDRF